MAEDHGLTLAPVLVVDFGTVSGGKRGHKNLLVSGWEMTWDGGSFWNFVR
jgi:hypothetical protein